VCQAIVEMTQLMKDHGLSHCEVQCYTHRVAISNSRLIAADATGVTFSYKDYRIEGPGRYKTMRLKPDEFTRRFLMHVLA
jgi:Putative transposase